MEKASLSTRTTYASKQLQKVQIDQLRSRSRRKWMYRRMKSCRFNNNSLFAEYRRARNAANNLYRKLKNDYFHGCCWTYQDNPSRLWSTIRCMTGRKQQKMTPNVPSQELNSYFASLVSSPTTPCFEVPFGPPSDTALKCLSLCRLYMFGGSWQIWMCY